MGKLLNIVKFCFSAALFGVAALMAGYYGLMVIQDDPSRMTEEKIVALVLLFILFVFCSVLFLPLASFMPERKRRIRLARFFVLVVLLGFIVFQTFDAPTPNTAHSQADLETAEKAPEQLSFLADALLLEKVGSFAYDVYFQETFLFCSPGDFSEEIQVAWRRFKPYRILIDQLTAYDRIPQRHRLGKSDAPNYGVLVNYGFVYRAYALLQADRNNLDEAVRELVTLQRFIRGGLAGAVGFDQKQAWFDLLQVNLDTAYQLTRDHDLTTNLLEELQNGFGPLDDAVLDVRQARIEEYLVKKRSLDLPFEQKFERGLLSARSDVYPLGDQPFWLQKLVYLLTFQRNRTALMLGDTWQPSPGLSPFLASWQQTLFSMQIDDMLDLDPPLRNLSGWLLFGSDSSETKTEAFAKLKEESDLFAKYLNQRLEGPADNVVLQPICRAE
jgi:hypothetical protein